MRHFFLALFLTTSTVLGLACPAIAAPSAEPDRVDAALNQVFDSIRGSPPRLRALLRLMPKGGDLHNHLAGSVYSEDYLRWAEEDDLCMAQDPLTFFAQPCSARLGAVAVRGLSAHDVWAYSKAVDNLSTRTQSVGPDQSAISGHDRFFGSFPRFFAVGSLHLGDAIAAVRDDAAYDNVSYVELQMIPKATWEVTARSEQLSLTDIDFAARLAALKPAVARAIASTRIELDDAEKRAAQTGRCGDRDQLPGCTVVTRYHLQARRDRSPASVFAQLALGFALATADPRFVGVNLATPEDWAISLRDYHLHMQMVAFLKAAYPGVKVSLHAGELAQGQVPPKDLRFHIREAVRIAGADRIGHGVDIAGEDDVFGLLAEMAHRHIAVEINLKSNDLILGVKGADHPLSMYRAAGVPLALSTDDAGVNRSDMTSDYMRAMVEQGLSYTELRTIAKNSLIYAFIPGAGLWNSDGSRKSGPCAHGRSPTPSCSALLSTDQKAALELRFEIDLSQFERVALTALPATVSRNPAVRRPSLLPMLRRQVADMLGARSATCYMPATSKVVAPLPATLFSKLRKNSPKGRRRR